MKRRRLLTVFGSLFAAGSLTLGSGAFTTVSAKRNITVDVSDDEDAFLSLTPILQTGIDGEQTGRAFTLADGRVMFSIPGTGFGESDVANGVAPDSIYEFHDLLRVENQGTQAVSVHSAYDGDALNDLALVHEGGLFRDAPPTLEIGESVAAGLYIDTHSSSLGEFDETLTIIADPPDE
jgi:hypothetical protein